jgi:hypothetical protein
MHADRGSMRMNARTINSSKTRARGASNGGGRRHAVRDDSNGPGCHIRRDTRRKQQTCHVRIPASHASQRANTQASTNRKI